mgnify:CR=1 FL=1
MFSDWLNFFWPQIGAPWNLQPGVYNLPWLFILLQPLRLGGPYGALVIVQIASLVVIAKLAQVLRVSKIRFVMVMLSPPVFWALFMGQLDGLFLAAYLLPPAGAIALTVVKPQVNAGAGWRAIRKQPWTVIIILVLAISVWAIWDWPFSVKPPPSGNPAERSPWNWSLWPVGVILAPALFFNDRRGGMLVSPFLFPYAGVQSLIGPMLVAATLPWWVFLPVWLGTWARWAYMLKLYP